MKLKILYFTTAGLAAPSNGGALVCRHHVRKMAQDPRLDVMLCNVGSDREGAPTQAFAESLGVPLHFILYQPDHPLRSQPPWAFSFELDALAQTHIDGALLDVIGKTKPDLVVVDYLFSALYVPSIFHLPIRKVAITLNREAEFYRATRRIYGYVSDPSEARLAEFEKSIYGRSDAVIVLSAGDLPAGLPAGRTHVIPPLFDPAPARWSYRGNRRIFFVGNAGHFPNALAIQWMATQLAPVLQSVCPQARLQVIGVDANRAPADWRRPNIDFLGVGDAFLVQEYLTSSDLFIAPIANNDGSKIKLLECLSHATPFVATEEAMSGLPFIRDVPRVRLDQPKAAAETVARLFLDETLLSALSNSLQAQLLQTIEEQKGIWGDLFESICARPPVHVPENATV